jgi:hypothetical protein
MRRLVDIAMFAASRETQIPDALKQAVRLKLQEYLFRLEEGETLEELERTERRTGGTERHRQQA